MKAIRSVLTVLLAFGAGGCSVKETEQQTESVSLQDRGILTNEYSVRKGPLTHWHYNKLFFQPNASAGREPVGEINGEVVDRISLHRSPPQIFTSGERMALVIGRSVFRRSADQRGARWSELRTDLDRVDKAFLRSFLKPSDPRIAVAPGRVELDVTYGFFKIDLDEDVLTTIRETSKPEFPKFLVYNAHDRFDIERTRKANGLIPPVVSNLVLDISAITYPGNPEHGEERASALARKGAREIHAETVPLSSSEWTNSEWTVTLPDGTAFKERFSALVGFLDPFPSSVSIFCSHHPLPWADSRPVPWAEWHDVRKGNWIRAGSSGFRGGLGRVVFIQVRQTQ